MFSCNMATWDRVIRVIVGILLVAWAIAGAPIWAWIGVVPIITGAWGYCPLYTVFKINTRKKDEQEE